MTCAVVEPSVSRAVLPDRRTLLPWYITEFIHSYCVTLYSACAYFFAETRLHATSSQRLWLAAAWGFAYVFFALLAGKLSERWGSRRLLLRMFPAGILAAASSLLLLFVPAMATLWGLLAVMMLYNFTANQMWPPLESAITRSPGKLSLSARMALYNLTWGASSFAAFFTLPFLKPHAGDTALLAWVPIFLVPVVGALLGGVVVKTLAIPQSMLLADHVPDESPSEDQATASRARTLLHMAWVANAMSYVAINALIPVLPDFVRQAGVSSDIAMAVLISLWTLARAAGFVITWRWTGWHYSVRWMLGAFVVLAASSAGMFLFPRTMPVLLGAQVFFGLAVAMLYASSLYYAMHVSSGAGGHAGIHEALIGIGFTLGPVGGALAGSGPHALSRITVSVSGILLVGFAALVVLAFRAGPRAARTAAIAADEPSATMDVS